MAFISVGIATAIWSVLMMTGSWSSQDRPIPTLSIADIVTKIGSETDARAVLIAVLAHAMENRSKREFFLASQVRNEWLPVGRATEFVRLSESEISGHLTACGSYWEIGNVQRNDNVVSLALGQKCRGTALFYMASFDGREWRLGPPNNNQGGWGPGIGSGFVGRPPGCPCLRD
jgi:hypothetical protein